jgi:hypothetical protein
VRIISRLLGPSAPLLEQAFAQTTVQSCPENCTNWQIISEGVFQQLIKIATQVFLHHT